MYIWMYHPATGVKCGHNRALLGNDAPDILCHRHYYQQQHCVGSPIDVFRLQGLKLKH
jgi:hypothetical protein